MSKLNDLSGQTFGRLQVIGFGGTDHNGARWVCRCECGTVFQIASRSLVSGNTKSCGCIQRECPAHTIHGDSHTRLHNIWMNMKARCRNNKLNSYKNYGGRGIIVCDEWKKSYEEFRAWAMQNKYADNLSIDRINNDGNYEPDNCRWTDNKTQANNTSRIKLISHNGITMNLVGWAETIGISYSTIEHRIARGCPMDKIINIPQTNAKRN